MVLGDASWLIEARPNHAVRAVGDYLIHSHLPSTQSHVPGWLGECTYYGILTKNNTFRYLGTKHLGREGLASHCSVYEVH